MGSIPARAGEPRAAFFARSARRVYPRPCGGTRQLDNLVWRYKGLSPPVRGNLPQVIGLVVVIGSIPARAGEPGGWSTPPSRSWVYPRPCGGTIAGPTSNSICLGLSPPVRGNRYPVERPQHPHGSIPACAGEPLSWMHQSRQAQVYPRPCGGTTQYFCIVIPLWGLSPPVRGNRRAGWRRPCSIRSIPARAGEP